MKKALTDWGLILREWTERYQDDPALESVIVAKIKFYVRTVIPAKTRRELEGLLSILEAEYNYPDATAYVKTLMASRNKFYREVGLLVDKALTLEIDLGTIIKDIDANMLDALQTRNVAGGLPPDKCAIMLERGYWVICPETEKFLKEVNKAN